MIPGVPDGSSKEAFKAFVQAVSTYPTLAHRRVIKTFRTWDGTSSVASVTADQMPLLQFRFMGNGPGRRIASTRRTGGAPTSISEVPILATVELWTKGTDQFDSSNLADMIQEAIHPQDDAARKALKARFMGVGIRDCHINAPILPPGPEAFTVDSIYAVGSYRLTLCVAS